MAYIARRKESNLKDLYAPRLKGEDSIKRESDSYHYLQFTNQNNGISQINVSQINFEMVGNCTSASAAFITQLVKSGANVEIFSRKDFGSLRLLLSDKAESKDLDSDKRSTAGSFALSARKPVELTSCVGVADLGAVWLAKSDMISLQLNNGCNSVNLVVYAENIFSSCFSAHCRYPNGDLNTGYLISGPTCINVSLLQEIRNVKELTVNLIV